MHTTEFFLKFKYLGEIETEFENTSAYLSGAQMGSNQEKNFRLKILGHTPFKITTLPLYHSFRTAEQR